MSELSPAFKRTVPYIFYGLAGAGVGVVILGVSTIPEIPPDNLTLKNGEQVQVCDNNYVVPSEATPGKRIDGLFDVIVRPVVYKNEIYAYGANMDDDVKLQRINNSGGYWITEQGERTDQSTCHNKINAGRILVKGMLFLSTEQNTPEQISRITGEGSACKAGAYALWYNLKTPREVQKINRYCPSTSSAEENK